MKLWIYASSLAPRTIFHIYICNLANSEDPEEMFHEGPHCLLLLSSEGVDRGGGGTGIEGAESGVEGAESGVEGAGSGSRGGGKRGNCGRGSGKIGGRNCFFTRKFINND